MTFEIFIAEQRRNTGRGGRCSIWRVWVIKLGRKKPWRDDQFPHREPAVHRFNLYRRTMNAAEAVEEKSRAGLAAL